MRALDATEMRTIEGGSWFCLAGPWIAFGCGVVLGAAFAYAALSD